MKTIHKYRLSPNDEVQEVRMPEDAVPLKAEYSLAAKAILMWAEVDASGVMDPEEDLRRFKVFHTGQGIPANAVYVDTTYNQMEPRSYHIYELVD
ncbi:MAG: hypothetical protein CVV10_01215 [Gammaproteobacteria bacterium HGW-Gammaproteobacteria-14]|jgi:hypothetical protein|nr:MAG: hypothetical protein CVV10_01215 [Gammaproteobacteria bacterium HGW-Gammaproteobacteria-14]